LAPEEQFARASAKFFRYVDRNRSKSRKWSWRLAHAAFTLHPELREEGSLERYFVARLGRERGYRGAELTTFVEQAYQSGLAKFAIEAGMAAGPRQPSGIAECVTHPSADPIQQCSPGAEPLFPNTFHHHKLPVRSQRTVDSEGTGMIVNSSTQIRVIRALLGMSPRDFSARLGVCPASLTNWERGRTTPGPERRQVLAELCQENGLGFMPSGMPVPFAQYFAFKPGDFTGWDSPFSPKARCMRAPGGDDSTIPAGA
jgi:DNA-binding transcriptional regulator YiaG